MRYDKKIESDNFPKTSIFSTKNIFRKILKNRKFQKVNFFAKKRKSLSFFRKSWLFWKSWVFQQKSKKVTFWNFRFFKIFRKYFPSKKIKVFGKVLRFIFVSYLMYYLIEWYRGTPTVPPVGAVNVPAENPKIQKIHIFEDFWGHFFLINHIGFSLKYVVPKSSTDFFSSKTKSVSKKIMFYVFIIFHPQSLKVSLRNSFYTAR